MPTPRRSRTRRPLPPLRLDPLESRLLLSSTIIPLQNLSDYVLDAAHNDLLLLQTDGTLQRYDLTSHSFLSSYNLGYAPTGMDVSPDGQFLYFTAATSQSGIVAINQLNLASGTIITIPGTFPDDPFPGGTLSSYTTAQLLDLAVTADNTVWITAKTSTYLTGTNVLFSFHPGDTALSLVPPIDAAVSTPGTAPIVKSEDNSSFGVLWTSPKFLVSQPVTSTFQIRPANAAAFTIGPSRQITAAVLNTDASRAVIGSSFSALSFYTGTHLDTQIPGIYALGMALDDDHHRLFVSDYYSHAIKVFDTSDFTNPIFLSTMPLTDAGDASSLLLSPDNSTLFYRTASGVQSIDLASYRHADFSLLTDVALLSNTPSTFQIQIKDLSGEIDTSFLGTVHFTSSDPLATLPHDYTFTAADSGQHTFSLTAGTLGSLTLSAVAPEVSTNPLATFVYSSPYTSVSVSPSSFDCSLGNSVTFTPSVTSFYNNSPILAGTVSLRNVDTGAIVATAQLQSGLASLTVTPDAIGTYRYVVEFAGSPFAPRTSLPATISVRHLRTLSATQNSSGLAGSFDVVEGVPLSGTFDLYEGNTLLASLPADTANPFFALNALPLGTHHLTLKYSGNAYYVPTETSNVTIYRNYPLFHTQITGTQLLVDQTSLNSSYPQTGTLELRENGTLLATAIFNNAIAAFDLSTLPAGAHVFSLHFNGNGICAPGDSNPLPYLQLPPGDLAAPSISLAFNAQGLLVTLAGADHLAAPTGTVALYDNAVLVGSFPITGAQTIIPLDFIANFIHTLSIAYDGDAQYGPATASAFVSSLFSNSITTTAQGTQLTVTYTPFPDGFPEFGTVDLLENNVAIATLPLQRTLTFNLASLSPGHHALTLRFNGNGLYAAISLLPAIDFSRPALAVPTLTTSISPLQDLTISLLDADNNPLTGTVELRESTVTLATMTLSSGQASFNLSAFNLLEGPHQFVIAYPGSNEFSPQSATVTYDYHKLKPFGSIDTLVGGALSGWAFDKSNTNGLATLTVIIDRRTFATFDADASRSDLANSLGSANHGFSFQLPTLPAGSHTLQIFSSWSASNTKTLLATRSFTTQTPLFDESWYLAHNPDVAKLVSAGKITAWNHFNLLGQFENRAPSPYFDPAYYLANNPDIAKALANKTIKSAWAHFLAAGQFTTRKASPFFDEKFYRLANPDIAKAISRGTLKSGLQHFLLAGQFEGRNPIPEFSASQYKATLAASSTSPSAIPSPYQHFLTTGLGANLPPSSTFDPASYLSLNPTLPALLTASHLSPLEHFLRFGLKQRLQASPTYSEAAYLAHNPDIAAAVAKGAFSSGLEHYILFGAKENRIAV